MPTSVSALRKVQIGQEVTAGTAVAATALWRGIAVRPASDDLHVIPEENIGVLSLTNRSYTPRRLAALEFPSTEMSPEQLPLILNSAIKKVTAVADGVGTGFVRTYATPVKFASVPAVTDLVTRTIEGGDNASAEEMEYSFVEEFTMSGKAEEAWMISSKWKGRSLTSTTFTAALTAPTVSEFQFGNSRLFIDAVSGTIGSTEISATLLEASLKQTTGWRPRFTANGGLTFALAEYTSPKATLELTLLLNANAVAQKAVWVSDAAQLIRIKSEGKSLATAGTYSKATLLKDMVGLITGFDDVSGDSNGSGIVKVTFEAVYDTVKDLFTSFTLVNENGTLI